MSIVRFYGLVHKLLSFLDSGYYSLHISRKERRSPYILKSQQSRCQSLKSDSHAAMGREPVFVRHQIACKRFNFHPARSHLCHLTVIGVNPLTAGCDLKSSEKQVKAFGYTVIVSAVHRIKGRFEDL